MFLLEALQNFPIALWTNSSFLTNPFIVHSLLAFPCIPSPLWQCPAVLPHAAWQPPQLSPVRFLPGPLAASSLPLLVPTSTPLSITVTLTLPGRVLLA